jgi:opacity protein-like surface antigen
MSAEDAPALAALGANAATTSSEAGLDEAQFNLYGFADFTFLTQLGRTSVTSSPYSSFMVGNFNVYFSTEFERHWRSLAEVRFMYLPHGAQAGTVDQLDPNRIDTLVVDGSNFQRAIRWGGIAIQRIWLEYNLNEYLTVRAGQWFTPYGIWISDHGSPTIVSVHRPYIIDQAWFPEQQTGLEAYGAFFIDDTKFGYHLTLSNGRGLVDSYQDLDNDKGVGARLYLQNDTLLGAFSLGVSGYRGAYTARATNGFGVKDGELVTVDPPTAKFDELDLAADLKWEWGGLLLQSEFILTDVRYPDELRPPPITSTLGPPGVQPDSRRFGVYALVGYRTPWWNAMPYVLLQRIHDIYSALDYIAGVNARPSARVTLKAEYEYVDFPTSAGLKLENLSVLAFQVAWSF